MKIKDVMDKFSGKGVPWGPTLTPSAAEELHLYLIELTREAFKAGFIEGKKVGFLEHISAPDADWDAHFEVDKSTDNGYGFEKEII